MNRIFYIIILSLFFIQCDGNKDKSVPIKNVPGKYIQLDAENIYLFVPENVKLFTNSEYIAFIKKIENEELKEIEYERYLNLKYGSAGNFYMMASEDRKLDIAFKTLPYIPINQEVSQEILSYLNSDHKALAGILGFQSSFKKAGIIKKGNDRIFRAIFMLKGKDESTGENMQGYTYFYLVNRKGKTFILTFNSGRANDFDSYVQKIRL
ncbi:hypothetical protein H2O64_03805 [Kordia sp. YSTF-M3]|uniref:Lipoprotein n=1 Tax=Kordia aestuariivivens TaxID=2759037 RepID=A0ABR7Q5F9_9FLAO|nr:hypothetical protein [Kordia aestuariivivens]MBC8753780.1 hypothetical protein [Kordia aestuariivivens]